MKKDLFDDWDWEEECDEEIILNGNMSNMEWRIKSDRKLIRQTRKDSSTSGSCSPKPKYQDTYIKPGKIYKYYDYKPSEKGKRIRKRRLTGKTTRPLG